MEFLFPGALLGLLLLAIPIIVHLFNFKRYRTVYFTRVGFLQQIQEQTKRQNNLKHLLVLLMRLLAILCLVLAFAQPLLRNQELNTTAKPNLVGIYIDNSFSMQGEGESGVLLDNAKSAAMNLAEGFENDQRFVLFANHTQSGGRNGITKTELLEQIAQIDFTASRSTVEEVIAKFTIGSNAGPKQLFLLSDFQENMLEGNRTFGDSNLMVSVVPFANQRLNNLYVDSVWFDEPVRKQNEMEQLFASIANLSNEEAKNLKVSLRVNDGVVASTQINVAANTKEQIEFSFIAPQTKTVFGEVIIEDYPITYDDVFHFAYTPDSANQVLLIHGNDSIAPFQKLFANDRYFKLQTQSQLQINLQELSNSSAVILYACKDLSSGLISALSSYANQGGIIIISPAAKASSDNLLSAFNVGSLGQLQSRRLRVNSLNYEDKIYKNVFTKVPDNPDLPVVDALFSQSPTASANTIMQLENGLALLNRYTVGNGSVYVFHTPLSPAYTNFTKHALFVPTLYQMALFSRPNAAVGYNLGKGDFMFSATNEGGNDPVFELISRMDQTAIIPEVRALGNQFYGNTNGNLNQDGGYLLQRKQGADTLAALAFNFDRNESVLTYANPAQVTDKLKSAGIEQVQVLEANANLSLAVQKAQNGFSLWPYLLALALLFLLIELLLLKYLP